MGSNICLSVSWLPQWYPCFGWAKGGENEVEEGSENEELMGTSYEHVPGRRERGLTKLNLLPNKKLHLTMEITVNDHFFTAHKNFKIITFSY